MQRETATAFGKLILLGEHAVVYGVPAIACALDRVLSAELTWLETGPTELVLLSETRLATDDDLLGRAFGALLRAGSGVPRAPLRVRITGALPPGMNLGFSAAAGVAAARAIESSAGGDAEAVKARADAWERIFHGTPSGIDVAVAMHGGVVKFRRGESVRPLQPRCALHFCVGFSAMKPTSTKSMVDAVAALRERDAVAFQAVLDGIEALMAPAERALLDGDLSVLGELMNRNHRLLARLELSTEALESLCSSARAAGAFGAKLTGAGGGGAMVALAGAGGMVETERVATRILDSWHEEGRSGFGVVVGLGRD